MHIPLDLDDLALMIPSTWRTLPSLGPFGKILKIHLKRHPLSLPLRRMSFSLIWVSRAQYLHSGLQNTFFVSAGNRIYFNICLFTVDADTLSIYKTVQEAAGLEADWHLERNPYAIKEKWPIIHMCAP